ncbi:hypothetical protein E8E15_004880 [Penicillium rubens]|nr:hypothetical protein E8E15_004880 [Penicillium rubens]
MVPPRTGSDLGCDDSGVRRKKQKSIYSPEEDYKAGYKFIVFGNNPGRIGGTRLKSSARSGADRTEGQRRTGYIMGGGSGEDPIGSILRQSDAAERMEVELFTRLEDW